MPSINIEYRFIPWESKILPSSMSQFNTEIIRRVTDTEIARMYGKHELQKLDALKISRDAQMHVFAHSVPSLMVKQRNKIFPCLHPSQVKEPALSEDLFVWIEALLWNLITTMEFDSPCRGMDAKRFCSLVRDVGKLFTKYVKEIMPEVVNEKLGKGFVYQDMICSTRKFQKSMEGNSLRGLKRQTILSRCSDLIILVHLARASWHICDHFQHTDKTEHVNRISDHPIAKKSSTFRKKKQICFSYVRKKCRFGINCTKKHVRKEVLKEIKCPHVLKENKCKYGGACLYDHSFKIWRRKKAVQPYQLHANAKQAAEERMAEVGVTVLQIPPPSSLPMKDRPNPIPPRVIQVSQMKGRSLHIKKVPPISIFNKSVLLRVAKENCKLLIESKVFQRLLLPSYQCNLRAMALRMENGYESPWGDVVFVTVHQLNLNRLEFILSAFDYVEPDGRTNRNSKMIFEQIFEKLPEHRKKICVWHDIYLGFWYACLDEDIWKEPMWSFQQRDGRRIWEESPKCSVRQMLEQLKERSYFSLDI